jgi:hypothetical protein
MADAGKPNWKDTLPINHGESLHFITRKSLTAADVSTTKQRLNIPAPDARSKLFPLLHHHERTGTINVTVHMKEWWKFSLKLTTYQTSGQTVILGKDYTTFIILCKLKEGEEVDMWAFRSGRDLHFAIEKTVS